MFTKILIANRGEIACRVAATARKMGIKTVAVYSEADAKAKHVAMCDEAVLLGAAPAKESYLRYEKIIQVALASGAQAIHPGYGFLSENSDFAQACHAAGLVFIGPPASAIEAMGSKSAAKTLMEQAGVPLVPGYHGENQEPDFLHNEADKMGYPVLLKASAGGGGKGMRVVDHSADFIEALASCKREAINSFGDDKVLVEKYLQRPRHIEIQVFADTKGNCVYLFERDCSVQRRHQKVLEEAPAPGMTEERRSAMGQAAVAAAKAVGYVGAGTVEFIVNQDHTFYFMEMNTRLQVEHPVTEMITATDLVEWQLRVAYGEQLPLLQTQLNIHGHALEARIYAENPEKGFLPAIGQLQHLRTPSAVNFQVGFELAGATPADCRIDSGVREGDAISPFYDPMIAKLIVWGKDRKQALSRMAQALAEYQIVGVHTNIAFLSRLISSPAFAQADLDTGLIERNQAHLFPVPLPATLISLAFASVALMQAEVNAASVGDPWQNTAGWRMNSQLQRQLQFAHEEEILTVQVTYQATGWKITQNENSLQVRLNSVNGQDFVLSLGELSLAATVVRDGKEGEHFHIFQQGQHLRLDYLDALAHAGEAEAHAGGLSAPMPGKIVAVLVNAGQEVQKGDALLIMEAMKMEHTITAPHDGVIEEVLYAVADQVTEGAALLRFAQ
ncbi:MAG: acetyl/propionyl/methylcrotonyl-CoA carboxylase subunit alpha [Undibacterium sp.]|nr:acetyl/propionyl/methylcrotonyl-CoA carboxylase subunit alpha [Undibacterium sp.]